MQDLRYLISRIEAIKPFKEVLIAGTYVIKCGATDTYTVGFRSGLSLPDVVSMVCNITQK